MSNKMKYALAGAAFACVALLSLTAEPAPAVLTVDQAVDAALRNNLGIKSVDMQTRIKKRESDFSFNKFYPTISATATALELNQAPTSVIFYNGAAMPYTAHKENAALGLTIQEVFSPVYLGLMIQTSIDYQASVVTRAKAEKQLASSVKKFYYQLIVQKEAIELTRSRLDNANERLRQAQVSFELGQGTELNYIYAKTNVESLIPDLRSMESARIMALTQFQEILGFDRRDDMELSGSLEDETLSSADGLKIEGSRFDVNEARITVKQAETAMHLQYMTLLPNLILQYSADPTINGPTASTITKSSNWNQSSGALALTLSWNLAGFLPGSDFQVTRAQIRDQLALATESAETTAKNALHDEDNQRRLIQDSLDKIENLKNVVSDTKRSYDLTDASYKAGVGRYLDMQAAELAWQGTQIQLLNERLNLMSLVDDFRAKYDTAN